MKISSIKINGYKNLIDCEYEMENFNVLIGANNSGKSNFLEIFSFLNILLTGSEDVKERLLNRGEMIKGKILSYCSNYDSNYISVELEFTEKVKKCVYKYVYDIEIYVSSKSEKYGKITKEIFKYKKISASGPMITVFERNDNAIKMKGQKIQEIDGSESIVSLISKIKDIKNNLDFSIQRGIECIFMICKTPILYSSPDIIRESIKNQSQVMKNGRIVSLALIDEIDKIIKSDKGLYFKEILEDVLAIKDIEVMNIGQNLKNLTLEFQDYQEISVSELSDGTLIAVNMITYLLSNNYPVIAIEELENSIHPKLLKKMIRLIKNNFNHIQIIITTHSPVLLNMVQVNEVSVISNNLCRAANIVQIKDNKELIKKLSSPFSDFGDIFYLIEE